MAPCRSEQEVDAVRHANIDLLEANEEVLCYLDDWQDSGFMHRGTGTLFLCKKETGEFSNNFVGKYTNFLKQQGQRSYPKKLSTDEVILPDNITEFPTRVARNLLRPGYGFSNE